MAQATGLRVLKAIGDAVPVRLMKRDLLFLAERLTAMLDERRLSVLIRQHGIGKPKDDAAPAKLLAAFLPKAEESKLGRILVETAILLSMHNQTDAAKILRDAAHAYKVDVDAISATVKQEFAAKEKSKPTRRPHSNQHRSPARKRLHNRQSIAQLSRSQQDRLRIFRARCAFARPHSMPANAGDHTDPPDAHAARPSAKRSLMHDLFRKDGVGFAPCRNTLKIPIRDVGTFGLREGGTSSAP